MTEPLAHLRNFRSLDLSNNQIDYFATSYFLGLTNLKHLNLSYNYILNMTEPFAHLKNLSSLDLSNNWIADLAARDFLGLPNLKHLNLSHNLLLKMPEPFAYLKNLRFLDLSNNRIEYLTASHFFGLTESCVVLVKGNNIFNMSTELFENKSCQSFLSANEVINLKFCFPSNSV